MLAEFLLGTPLFPGPTAVDQLIEIVRVIGTPSKDEVMTMNPNYQEYKSFPVVRAPSWSQIFKPGTPPEVMDLISDVLVYYPNVRLKAIEASGHEFFDELRDPKTEFREEYDKEKLYEITQAELSLAPEMEKRLVPRHHHSHSNK